MYLPKPPEVTIGETPISKFEHISINQSMESHHTASVSFEVLNSKSGPQTGDPFFRNFHDDYLGKIITIKISDDNNFKGVVTELTVIRQNGAGFTIQVIAKGLTILLEDGLWCRSFEGKTFKQIVDDVAKNVTQDKHNGLILASESNLNSPFPYTVQYKETNFQFLSRLAAKNGQWFYYDGQELVAGKYKSNSKKTTLIIGKNLKYFNLSIKLTPITFSLVGYDYLIDKPIEANNENHQPVEKYGKFGKERSDQVFKDVNTLFVPMNEEEMKEQAIRIEQSKTNELLIANGSSESQDLKVGSIINVSQLASAVGPSALINVGSFLIISLNQSISSGNSYSNTFEAIPAEVSTPRFNPYVKLPVCETQTATVIDTNDPEKLGRVKVKFVWQKDNDEAKLPWIRVATLQAGKDHGTFFLPEKEDKVLVAFEHSNPEYPYVTGSLYTGKVKPDSTNDHENNFTKAIKTKSGNEIRFSDEEGKEYIHIYNKEKENELLLSLEEDGQIVIRTKGKMLFEAKDISMKSETFKIEAEDEYTLSSKKIQATAEDEMSLSAKELNAEAQSTLSMKGNEVEIEAKSKAEVKANSQLSLKGSAQVEVKGGVIKLN